MCCLQRNWFWGEQIAPLNSPGSATDIISSWSWLYRPRSTLFGLSIGSVGVSWRPLRPTVWVSLCPTGEVIGGRVVTTRFRKHQLLSFYSSCSNHDVHVQRIIYQIVPHGCNIDWHWTIWHFIPRRGQMLRRFRCLQLLLQAWPIHRMIFYQELNVFRAVPVCKKYEILD